MDESFKGLAETSLVPKMREEARLAHEQSQLDARLKACQEEAAAFG